jgi:ATP-binding cassette subfamily F protein 3
MSLKYGDKTILKDISLLVERGSKIAFVGQNGKVNQIKGYCQ